MKKLLISFSLVVITFLTYGQAHEGYVDIQKVPRAAAIIELPYSSDIVDDAISEYLAKKGKSDIKGFTSYRNSLSQHSDSANAELYLRVERKSRKEKEITVVSLLLANSTDFTPPNTGVHYLTMEEAKEVLNSLIPVVTAYDLELKIKDQSQVVNKSESKYKSLVNRSEDLEKKRLNIEKDIAENKKDIADQNKEIELQKQKLATLISQRKSK